MGISIRNLMRRMFSRPDVPMALVGDPGYGKTAQVQEAGWELGYDVYTIIGSTREETDIAGIPALVNGRSTTITPDWGLALQEKPGVLLLDEFNRARPEVLNAMLSLVHGRQFPNGRDRLHEHTIIIAVMNDPEMVDAEHLCPAMNNRFGWVDLGIPSMQSALCWFLTGSFEYESVAAKQEAEGIEKKINPPSAPPMTKKEWRKAFWSSDDAFADTKELLKRVFNTEARFAEGKVFSDQRNNLTMRSMENLLYFGGDAAHVASYAHFFLDARNANVIKTAFAKMKRSAPNIAMKQGREVVGSTDDSERLQMAATVNRKVVQQRLAKLADNDTDDDDDI